MKWWTIPLILLVTAALTIAPFPILAWLQDRHVINTTQARPAPTLEEEYGGNPEVYRRIRAMTDCAALQREFDTAYENHDREFRRGDTQKMKWCSGYMHAADQRMHELGCAGAR